MLRAYYALAHLKHPTCVTVSNSHESQYQPSVRPSFQGLGNRESEGLRDFSKDTQLLSAEAGI